MFRCVNVEISDTIPERKCMIIHFNTMRDETDQSRVIISLYRSIDRSNGNTHSDTYITAWTSRSKRELIFEHSDTNRPSWFDPDLSFVERHELRYTLYQEILESFDFERSPDRHTEIVQLCVRIIIACLEHMKFI